MTFNLIEFKNRLMYSFVMFTLIALISFFYKESLLYFVIKSSLFQTENELPFFIYTNLTEVFLTYIKLSILTGIYLTAPFFLLHLWLFFIPGLYKFEYQRAKRIFIIFIYLWLFNNLFIYNFLFPCIWNFFLRFETDSSKSPVRLCFEIKLNEYIEFLLTTIIYFSLGSQFVLLAILYVLNKNQYNLFSLKKVRRYIYVFSFIFATLITPPDLMSQLFLGILIVTFYEFLTLLLLIRNEYYFKII
jgi:sec-independent protein translocase protein TatC